MYDAVLPDWFAHALEGFTAGDMERFVKIYHPDAVHEFPIGPAPAPERLEGREAIGEYLKSVPERGKFDAIDVLSVRDMGSNPQVEGELVIEAQGRGAFHDGTPFETRYVWFVKHQDRQVRNFREYVTLRLSELPD